ncbi:MAG: D-beta-hydroxybutyrate dehydrogenase [Firmicutes bacterium]|nr:D-beta-hydroxybutyrate dehydrogenase [Bacillota bacterium]
MKAPLSGRAAVVTGAGSGIGRAIAVALAAAGADVLAADRLPDRAEETVRAIVALGGRAAALGGDISDPDSVQALIDTAVERFGGVGILVNNAGLQHVAPIEEFPLERWNRLISVMLTGPFLCTRAALPHMRRAGWGRIINIASIHGKVASPFKAAYVSAKHGLVGLTRTTAIETAAAGITANAICPGFVDTPLVRNQIPDLMRNFGVQTAEEALEIAVFSKTPQRRLLDPEEVGALAVYLAGHAARGVTGQAINLDGGMVMY